MYGNRIDEDSEDYGPLTRQQAENIADLAARRTANKLYAEIGKNVVSKALFIIGSTLLALAAWVNGWIGGSPK